MSIKSTQGSLLGASLLIAGCSIGAGMLGLPVLTAIAGFGPSCLVLALSWLFMATTGLLLLEVNLWFHKEVSLITMAESTLGHVGKWVCWGTFLFLFYCVLVAYVAASGDLFSDFTQTPSWLGSLLFTLFFGTLIYIGTEVVDRCNRLLMIGLIGSFLTLLLMGIPQISSENLRHQNWNAALYIVPPMVIAFGYHNLIPTLTTYLGHSRRRLIMSILLGSLLTLAISVSWEWLILGIVPLEGAGGLEQSLREGRMATHALITALGSSWVVTASQLMAFFVIVTSLLSVALSFVDFLADGLGILKDRRGKGFLCSVTLAPPFALALLSPGIFLTALNYAGAFGAVILFGILPACMVWRGRYQQGRQEPVIVPGGRLALILVIALATGVTTLQLLRELGLMGRSL